MKPIGSLYVYGDEHVIKFEENLRAYYENAKALKNNTKVLAKMCDNLHTPNCPHYKKKTIRRHFRSSNARTSVFQSEQ